MISTPEKPTTFYTVEQVAEMLGVAAPTIYREIRDKKLASFRIGRKNIRIRKEDVDAYLEAQRQPATFEGQQEGKKEEKQ